MRTRLHRGALLVLLGLPVVAIVLWLSSGREFVTKSGRAVTVQVKDELFGGVNEETQLVPGPIMGYYIGLDVVGVVTAAALGCGVVLWWVSSHRRRRGPSVEGGAQHA
jgi:hypothetical protein